MKKTFKQFIQEAEELRSKDQPSKPKKRINKRERVKRAEEFWNERIKQESENV